MKTKKILTLALLVMALSCSDDDQLETNTIQSEFFTLKQNNSCNTGTFTLNITWAPFVSKAQKQIVRDSYNPYGRLPEYLFGIDVDTEYWSFNLDNMEPHLVPTDGSCRTSVILSKTNEDEEIEDEEENTLD